MVFKIYYSPDVIEDLRNHLDIVDIISAYTPLKQKGSSYFALCPFHKENSPSFSVSRDMQLYHCFGCGASGNVFSFLMRHENLDFVESIKFLAENVNYKLPDIANYSDGSLYETKKILEEIHKISARFYFDNLENEENSEALNYLTERNIDNITIRKFGIGFSNNEGSSLFNHLLGYGFDIDTVLKSGLVLRGKNENFYDRFRNRIMFPIFNVQNKVIGFGGRILQNGEPKYLNSPETPIFEKSKNLYGLNFAKKTKNRELILVEGYMDVVSLHKNGFTNSVASLGTAFNSNHVNILKKYCDTVTLLFDSDEAGQRATLKTISLLTTYNLKIKVLKLSNCKDPDEFINKNGKDAFAEELSNAQSHISYLIDEELKNFNLENVSEKVEFTMKVSKILSSLQNDVEIDAYAKNVAEITGISIDAIKQDTEKLRGEFKPTLNLQKKGNYINSLSKSINEAKKSLIFIIADNYIVYNSIHEVLHHDEFNNPIYSRVVQIIYDLHKNKKEILPANIVNYFETSSEQEIVSSIFNTAVKFQDINKLEKFMNDLLKNVKKSYINEKASTEKDIAMIQELIISKRKLETLYIPLVQG